MENFNEDLKMSENKNIVRTKIVATLGPASSSYEMIKQLLEAGATMFRLNTSHGSEEGHAENIKTIRKVAKELNKLLNTKTVSIDTVFLLYE